MFKYCANPLSHCTCGYSCTCVKASYYRKLSGSKSSFVFLFNLIERTCNSIVAYRKKIRLLAKIKELSHLRDGKIMCMKVKKVQSVPPPACNRERKENFMNELCLRGENRKNGTIRSDRMEARSTTGALRLWQSEYVSRRYAYQDFSPPKFGAVKTYN